MSAPLSQNAKTLIDRAKEQNRRALALGLAAALFLTAFLLFFGAVSVLWSLVVGYYVFFNRRRSDRVVLWLRKFHERERGRLRFSVLLSRACFGMAVPITLQDSSFRASYFASGSRFILSVPVLLAGGPMVIAVLVLVAYSTAMSLGSEAAATTMAVALGLGLLLVWLRGVKLLFERGGYRTLDRRGAEKSLEGLLSRIRRKKAIAMGVLVLKCDDQSWKDVVRVGLQGADAIVIDVTEPSANVLWELHAASELVPERPIVLACQTQAGDPERLPRGIEEKVRGAVGESKASQWPVIYYPAKQPPVGRAGARAFEAIFFTLRSAVAEALSLRASDAPGPRPPARAAADVWRDCFIAVIATASAVFVGLSLTLGPYDRKNALEALAGSGVIATVLCLPLLAWMFWRRRRR